MEYNFNENPERMPSREIRQTGGIHLVEYALDILATGEHWTNQSRSLLMDELCIAVKNNVEPERLQRAVQKGYENSIYGQSNIPFPSWALEMFDKDSGGIL